MNSILCLVRSTRWTWRRSFVGIVMNMVISRDTAETRRNQDRNQNQNRHQCWDRKYDDRLNLAYEWLDGDSLYLMNRGNFDNNEPEDQEYFAQIVHQMDHTTLICDLESEPTDFPHPSDDEDYVGSPTKNVPHRLYQLEFGE
jgi:hypothetical protein